MSIKSAVISQIQQVAAENGINLPPVTDDLILVESGLDSLATAILVTRLEEIFELDPFAESEDFPHIVTLGDFVRFYENAARSRDVDSGQAG